MPKQITKGRGNNGDYIYNGIDRLDNSVGYTKENCVPCYKMCNYAKNKFTMEEFLIWINRVYHYQTREDYLSITNEEYQIIGDGTADWYKDELLREGLSGYNHL